MFKGFRSTWKVLVSGSFLLAACGVQKNNTVSAQALPDSSSAVIRFQKKTEFVSADGRIHFSNRFASARLNGFQQQNDSTFRITITPENAPINASPWYAFKVWTSDPGGSRNSFVKNIVVQLQYPTTKHRYDPKISYNGLNWKDVENVKPDHDKGGAEFKIKVSRDTLTVAAQELINTAAGYQWADSLAALPFLKKQVIGYSLLGKPVIALTTTGSPEKKLVVVLSRQHPPEVTGYMAMQEFVRTVTGKSALAQKFRTVYELVVIPMMNPDGVDEGNWRHSAAGVDLNRDWEFFKQPETKAVKDFLMALSVNQKAKVYFGIDFHSTYNDVFYTNQDQPDVQTNIPGFTVEWLKAFEEAIPGFKANIKPSPNGGNVSKSWMGRALGAEALTYEVGDKTSRSMLKTKGRVAAEAMMALLLKRNE